MNQTLLTPSITNRANSTREVPPPTLPTEPSHDASADFIGRIEANFEQLDILWADLDRGTFELAAKESPEREAPKRQARSREARRSPAEFAAKSHVDRLALANCRVSVVIPVYNERKTILRVIEQVQQLPLATEIIVVDDCSTDGTSGWLETVRGTPGLRIILKSQNEGKGAALRTGFAAATGDVVIVQDADFEYDPRDIPNVIRPIVTGHADVSYGSRYLNGQGRDGSLLHRFGNWLLTTCSNRLNGVQLTDMETGAKAFRREVLHEIELKQNRFGFEPEITAKLARRRYRIKEVPIQYNPRGYAEGKKIGINDLFSTLYCILRYGWAD